MQLELRCKMQDAIEFCFFKTTNKRSCLVKKNYLSRFRIVVYFLGALCLSIITLFLPKGHSATPKLGEQTMNFTPPQQSLQIFPLEELSADLKVDYDQLIDDIEIKLAKITLNDPRIVTKTIRINRKPAVLPKKIGKKTSKKRSRTRTN